MDIRPFNGNGSFAPSIIDELLDTLERSTPIRSRQAALKTGLLALDVEETDDSYIITADAPGIDKDAIEVTVSRDKVVLSVKPKEGQDNEDNKKFLYRERRPAAATRTLALANVSSEKVEAELKDGLLIITLGKDESRLPRKIAIR